MTLTTAILIYALGIVIGAIGMGAYMRPNGRVAFDWTDYTLFSFIILLWPVLLALAIGIVLPVAIVLGMTFYIIKFLMWIGECIGKGFDKWLYHRRIAREARKDEDAKNG